MGDTLLLGMLLHKKCVLVQKRSGYPTNGTSMSVSISLLASLVMKCMIQSIAKLNLILRVNYDAMLPVAIMGYLTYL